MKNSYSPAATSMASTHASALAVQRASVDPQRHRRRRQVPVAIRDRQGHRPPRRRRREERRPARAVVCHHGPVPACPVPPPLVSADPGGAVTPRAGRSAPGALANSTGKACRSRRQGCDRARQGGRQGSGSALERPCDKACAVTAGALLARRVTRANSRRARWPAPGAATCRGGVRGRRPQAVPLPPVEAGPGLRRQPRGAPWKPLPPGTF